MTSAIRFTDNTHLGQLPDHKTAARSKALILAEDSQGGKVREAAFEPRYSGRGIVALLRSAGVHSALLGIFEKLALQVF